MNKNGFVLLDYGSHVVIIIIVDSQHNLFSIPTHLHTFYEEPLRFCCAGFPAHCNHWSEARQHWFHVNKALIPLCLPNAVHMKKQLYHTQTAKWTRGLFSNVKLFLELLLLLLLNNIIVATVVVTVDGSHIIITPEWTAQTDTNCTN